MGNDVALNQSGQEVQPSLPPALTSLMIFATGPWRMPDRITQAMVEGARQAIPDFDRHLEPALSEWLVNRILALLAHYFAANHEVKVAKQAMLDWVKMLSPYPQWCVAKACEEWLAQPDGKKPTPGNIRGICERLITPERTARWRLKQLSQVSPTEIVDRPAYRPTADEIRAKIRPKTMVRDPSDGSESGTHAEHHE